MDAALVTRASPDVIAGEGEGCKPHTRGGHRACCRNKFDANSAGLYFGQTLNAQRQRNKELPCAIDSKSASALFLSQSPIDFRHTPHP